MAVGRVKISLPSTIICTDWSSPARSSARVPRSASQSGPTLTLTFVTPWLEHGVEQLEVERRRSFLQEHAGGVHLDLVPHPADHVGDRAARVPADEVPQGQLDGAAGLGGDPGVTQAPTGEQAQALGQRLDGDHRLPEQQRGEDVLDDGGHHGGVRAAVAVAGLARRRRRPSSVAICTNRNDIVSRPAGSVAGRATTVVMIIGSGLIVRPYCTLGGMATAAPPPPTLLTHIALPVRDLDATLAFYEKYTTLVNIHQRADPDTGLRTVWLANERDVTVEGAARFVIVLICGSLPKNDHRRHQGGVRLPAVHQPPRALARHPRRRRPHRGDGRAEGCLLLGPMYRNEVVGYICVVTDPDGNNLEFSVEQVLG